MKISNFAPYHRLMSRISYSFRIKNGYGLDVVRNKRELKALIAFCRAELLDVEHMKLNPMRKWVYETTLKLHDWDIENLTVKQSKKLIDSIFKNKNNVNKIRYVSAHQFIEDHVGWYWN